MKKYIIGDMIDLTYQAEDEKGALPQFYMSVYKDHMLTVPEIIFIDDIAYYLIYESYPYSVEKEIRN